MSSRLFSIMLLVSISSTAISGVINKCVSSDGQIEFSDKPCVMDASSNFKSQSLQESLPMYKETVGSDNKSKQSVITTISSMSTLAGSNKQEGAIDGIGTSARFGNPASITSDGANLYITEAGNSIIRKLELATGRVTTLAGSAGKRGSMDGIGRNASFNAPQGITNDGTNLYVVDSSNQCIRKVVISTGEVTTLAGNPAISGRSDGIGKEAQFSRPVDITTDGVNLYVTDEYASTVRKIEISSRQVTTLAGNTVIDNSDGVTRFITASVDGNGKSARFGMPFGITNDGKNLYVTDMYYNNIRKIVIATGEVTTLAGPDGTTYTANWKGRGLSGIVDGTGSTIRFSYPEFIATDGTYLYVTASNNTIRKIAIKTGLVTTLISREANAKTATAFASQLEKISGILVSKDHGLIITDRIGHVIYKLQ